MPHTPRNAGTKWLISVSALVVTLATAGILLVNHAAQPDVAVPNGQPINLLAGKWQYMPGATQQNGSLRIVATDAKLTDRDDKDSQPNPPVNLYGTYLQTNGDFRLQSQLAGKNGTATLRLYNSIPITGDTFRINPASVAVSKGTDTLGVTAWEGSGTQNILHPNPVFAQSVHLGDAQCGLVIDRTKNNLRISCGAATITVNNKAKLLNSGSVWLGLSSNDGAFGVTKLTAQALNSSRVALADTSTGNSTARDAEGLQTLATVKRPGFQVGAAIALAPFVSDKTYDSQLLGNFGSISMESALSPQSLSPKRGVYTFQEADALVAVARRNGLAVHGQALATTEGSPTWMRSLPTATAAQRAATAKILLDYISHVAQHYKGAFTSLDIANEPLDSVQKDGLQHNIWYKAMGKNYLVQVSQAVHQIDPNIQQYINETRAEGPGIQQDNLLALAQYVNASGGFIYGVGLQAHVYDMTSDALDGTALKNTINRFGKAGLKVRISENDVTDDSGTTTQAGQYAVAFTTCFSNPSCVAYTTWGVNDRYDWYIDSTGKLQQGHDLLFNNLTPTIAYSTLINSVR